MSGFLKTRKRTTSFLVPFGNLFLKLAGTHQRLLYRSEAWAEREVLALTALYGEEVRTDRPSRRALWISDFGARSVRDHLRLTSRRMNPQELARAAAVELRRFHDLQQEGRPYFFIHGDPHAGNILYCERRKRAFLIDFETMAVPTSALLGRCPKATHSETTESMRAEDLAIFILDILRELDPMDWMPVTRAFLDAYGVEEAVHVKLFKHLAPEGGESSLFRSTLWRLRVRTGSKGSYLLFIAKLRSISSHGRNQEALKHFERVCDPVSYFHK